jgi:hypothetical protein
MNILSQSVLIPTIGLSCIFQSHCDEWTRHSFSLPEGIWSVEAVDLNGDSKLDLVAMGETRVFALLAPDWQQRLLQDTKEPKMLYCAAIDADADGDLDLAVGRYRVPWIEHRQAGGAGPTPTGPDFSVAWIENTGRLEEPLPLHVIDRELNGIHGLTVGDLNGDGQNDLIADSINGPFFPKSILWFTATGKGRSDFKRHIITKAGADGRPHYLDTADLNGDGRLDVLLGDSQDGTFMWWQQAEKPEDTWTKHRIARIAGATNIRPGDVDGDGVRDVVGSCGHGKGVFWFKAASWKQHPIDPDFATPHALAVGDFDKDGDLDAAAASFTAFAVRWYKNDGKGAFSTHEIDVGNRQQAYDLKALDLDGDNALDLILAGRETKNAAWYRNNLTHSP